MFKRITDKKDFIQDPTLEMNEQEIEKASTDKIVLFDKEYRMYSDEWKHHVHIKCTDRCDANCAFCIEKSERNNPQNAKNLMHSTAEVLLQLAMQGHLKTVSITGGEPTIFVKIKELINLINSFHLTLFSINTNGRFLKKIPTDFYGWVNISKHSIDDRDIFNRSYVVDSSNITSFKKNHPNAKVRLQCVLGVTEDMNTLEDIIEFIVKYRDCVDDFSFRNLIIENDESHVDDLLLDLRDLMFNHGEFVEQVIQDYYVYETYKFLGTTVTLSWSNMKELKEYNESHDSNFLEEIIVHPDGMVTGSWNKKSLIIHNPEDRSKDSFIECKGVGCKHPCKRHISKQSPSSVISCATDSCGSSTIDSCGYSVNCCDSSIDSCSSLVDSCGSISSC